MNFTHIIKNYIIVILKNIFKSNYLNKNYFNKTIFSLINIFHSRFAYNIAVSKNILGSLSVTKIIFARHFALKTMMQFYSGGPEKLSGIVSCMGSGEEREWVIILILINFQI